MPVPRHAAGFAAIGLAVVFLAVAAVSAADAAERAEASDANAAELR